MAQSFDVCIRGDGMVARCLALLLARDRLRVALYRPQAGPAAHDVAQADVRAYALNRASRELLSALRVWPESPLSTPMTGMQVWGDDGGRLDFAPPEGSGQMAWLVEVPALQSQLAQALHFAPEVHTVTDLAQVKAALTVVCEGPASRSRSDFGVQWTVKPYGQKALAARLLSTAAHGGVARQWFQGGDILALLPMGGADGRELALVWSVSQARAAELQALTTEEFSQAVQAAVGLEAGTGRRAASSSGHRPLQRAAALDDRADGAGAAGPRCSAGGGDDRRTAQRACGADRRQRPCTARHRRAALPGGGAGRWHRQHRLPGTRQRWPDSGRRPL